MKNLKFKIIIALFAVVLSSIALNSCKTKHKMIAKSDLEDKSLITKSDSTKVSINKTTTKSSADTTKKSNEHTKETTTRTYTEIEIEMWEPDIKTDTTGNSAKNDLVNSILSGAKSVKMKIWDYQNKKEAGKSEEQKGLSESSSTSKLKDLTSGSRSSDQKNIKSSSSLVVKDKDSSAKANWIGWLIGVPAGILLLWLIYKGYMLLRK